jgi:uncharacterized heparinase superfamily protein
MSDIPLTSLYLYAHTAARMKPRQVAGVFDRKARELVVPRLPVDFDRRYERRVPASLDVTLAPFAANTAVLRRSVGKPTRERYRAGVQGAMVGELTFMNRTVDIAGPAGVDWYDDRLADLPRLWRLKLYGFQFLSWIALGVDPTADDAPETLRGADRWVRDWMESVEIGGPRYLRRAWTPYATSLRLINWIHYLAWRDAVTDAHGSGSPGPFEAAFRREIYKNALFLRNHIERDVGGNHLAENGAALVMAGLLFDDDANDWLSTGLSVLADVGSTQFLSDGGHFERSPMYHVLVLTRFLTVCDLLDRFGRSTPDAVRTPAVAGVRFLRFLRPPDGRLPLVNDAVHGESLSLDACLRYAASVGISPDGGEAGQRLSAVDSGPVIEAGPPRRSDDVADNGSGYYWLRTGAGELLVDGGPLGPPHLPGHAHSDILNVLLWVHGRPVVTDTGTFDYERGPRRAYARGIEGHNTVQVGDYEPVPLGGRFLMGPRPTLTVRVASSDAVALFEGRYSASPLDGPAYTHHRAIYAGDSWWYVRDRVWGHETNPVRSRLHLHPDVSAVRTEDGRVRLRHDDGTTDPVDVWLHPQGASRDALTSGWYFPRFGEAIERSVVDLYADASTTPATVGYVVTAADQSPSVTTTGDGSPALVVDGRRHALPPPTL